MSDEDELSEEDIAPFNEYIEQRDAVYRQRNDKRYDGVLGRLPTWVPESDQEEFEVTRNRLLDKRVNDVPLSAQVVRDYIRIYMQLGINRDSTIAKPGEQTDGPEWIPPEVMKDVGYLARVHWAVSLGEDRGLQELSGKMAVRGAAYSKGYSKGGRAPKRKRGIWNAVQELVKANPTITTKKAWLSFADANNECCDPIEQVAGFEIYRDGDDLVQQDGKTEREVAIKYCSFKRYVSDAKRSK